MNKPRILWSSQSPSLFTGYSIVTKNILAGLHKLDKYEIACQAWHEMPAQNPRYANEASSAVNFPYKLFHAGAAVAGDNPHDNLGRKNFSDIINDFKPDLTIMYGDIFMLEWINDHPLKNKTKIAMYYPIDGIPTPPAWIKTLELCDYIIPFSQFGSNATKEYLPNKPHIMIPHGIDYDFWSTPVHPIQIQMKKMEMFGNPDVFIIGSFDRNQPRKNIPCIIEAFSAHVKDHPKSRLLLHMANIDQGWNIMQLCYDFKIQDKVHITPNINAAHGISDEDMRLLYNCCDININTAWGEGWGLNISHSLTCGVPVFASDYTTTKELVTDNKAGEAIPVSLYLVEPMTHIRRAQIHPMVLANMLNSAYNNQNKLKELGKNGQEAMKQYDWKKVIPMWEHAIDQILSEPKKKILRAEVI